MDDIPDILKLALSTLKNENMRDQYDSFLEWAEGGIELNPEHLGEDALHMATEAHHFGIEQLQNGKLKLVLQQLRTPPSPPPPGTVRREEPPQEAQQQTQQQAQPGKRVIQAGPSVTPEEIGLVAGDVPPLSIGNKVFTYTFRWWHLQHAQLVHEKRPVKRTYAKLLWRNSHSGHGHAMTEYFAGNYPKDTFTPGQQYGALLLRETISGRLYTASYGFIHNRTVILVSSFAGLYHVFPWLIDHRTWMNVYPEYEQPPGDWLGFGDPSSDIAMDAAVKYVHDSLYWNLQFICGWDCTKANAERILVNALEAAISPYNFNHRRLKKRHGIDTGQWKKGWFR